MYSNARAGGGPPVNISKRLQQGHRDLLRFCLLHRGVGCSAFVVVSFAPVVRLRSRSASVWSFRVSAVSLIPNFFVFGVGF